MAIEHCRNLTIKMGQLSEETIKMALELLSDDEYDEEKEKLVITNEGIIDSYEDKLGTYLVKLSSRSITVHDSNTVSMLLHAIGDFERISDHSMNIIESTEELMSKKMKFSDAARKEISSLGIAVDEILGLACKAFCNNDLDAARDVEPLEEVIDKIKDKLRSNHISRLQQGECSIETGFVWSDLLTNLERISDHCSNIAGCVIEIKQNSMDMHSYLGEMKSGENKLFNDHFKTFSEKFALPEKTA